MQRKVSSRADPDSRLAGFSATIIASTSASPSCGLATERLVMVFIAIAETFVARRIAVDNLRGKGTDTLERIMDSPPPCHQFGPCR